MLAGRASHGLPAALPTLENSGPGYFRSVALRKKSFM